MQGNLYQLQELTGWYGGKVLYFGDHVYSDLAVSTSAHPKFHTITFHHSFHFLSASTSASEEYIYRKSTFSDLFHKHTHKQQNLEILCEFQRLENKPGKSRMVMENS